MNQPTTQQLLGLRLDALARDHQDVAAMRACIQGTPDSLVKELMDTWLACPRGAGRCGTASGQGFLHGGTGRCLKLLSIVGGRD